MRHGLGGIDAEQNWPGCEKGVYLAEAPEICLFIMLDQYAQFGDPHSSPTKHLSEIVVIVIDATRLDPAKLGPDPLINRPDVQLYNGTIDVRGMPILTVDDVMHNASATDASNG